MFSEVEKLKKGICGVYLIKGPTGKVYVGESLDVKRRLFMHISAADVGKMLPLYEDMRLYSKDLFTFEILVECDPKDLLYYESLFQTKYSAIGGSGYNTIVTKLTDKKREVTEEAKKNLSLSGLHKKHSQQTKDKVREQATGRLHREDVKKVIGDSKKGDKNYNAKKVKCLNTGLIFDNCSDAARHFGYPPSSVNKNLRGERNLDKYKHLRFLDYTKDLVLNLVTGLVYDTMLEAAETYNIPKRRLTDRLKGRVENNTDFVLVKCKPEI